MQAGLPSVSALSPPPARCCLGTGPCQQLLTSRQHVSILTKSRALHPPPGHGAARHKRCSIQPHATAAQLVSPELLTTIQTSPVRDLCATAFAAVGATVWVKFFDWLSVNGYLEQKLSRKLVHMTAGPLFLLTWPLFRLVLIGTGVVDSPGTVKAVSREGDRAELLRGPLYYVLVLIAATLVYWRESPVGLVALSLMCGGDGLADIVGRRLGKTKLPYNPNKTYAGSLAMFLGGAVMSMGLIALFCQLGFFTCDLGHAAACVAAISAIATLVESLPINMQLDDNLSVPGSAALVGALLLRSAIPVVL